MNMEFYYHDISPPSQAVWMALNQLGIKYEAIEVGVLKGEQKSKEYLAINPRGKVPAIKDGNFALAESRAIGVYLCVAYESKEKAEKLYPTDPKQMGLVNMILNIDADLYGKIYDYASIGRMLQGLPLEEDKLPGVYSALATLESLLSKTTFLVQNYPTLADIFVLSSVKLLDLTPFNEFGKYPKLQSWKKAMETQPHYEESMGNHVRKWAKKFLAKN